MQKLILGFLLVLITISSFATTEEAETNKILNIQHWNTHNGMRVYYVNAQELPIVDIKVAFDAGSARDQGKDGVAALTSVLLDQGAAGMDANEIATEFERVGAIFGSQTGRDIALISLRSLTKENLLNHALDTFANVLTKPNFSQTAFKRQQRSQLAGITMKLQSPSDVASDAFYQNLFSGHPYSHPVSGTKESVENLTRDDVNAFYHRYYVAKNAVMILVGAVDVSHAHRMAEKLSRGLAIGHQAGALPQPKNLSAAIEKNIPFPASQTRIRMGGVGMSYQDKDYFPLIVGNYSLGGSGLVSRLAEKIRNKHGLSYSVYSRFLPLAKRGPFIVSLGTRNQKAKSALAMTRKTLRKFVKQGPTRKELTAAKKNLIGGFPLQLDSNAKIASIITKIAFYQLPIDYLDTYQANIKAITTAQIRKAFKKYVHPDKMVTISVGGKNQS